MKKHTTVVGSAGTHRGRSLLSFRHHNPLARLLSIVASFAIAMLLVASTSPAQADDPAPADPTVTTTDAPAPDTSTDAPADTLSDPPADTGASTGGATDAPAADHTAPATTNSTAGGTESSTGSGTTSLTARPATFKAALQNLADVCTGGPGVVIGLFEIDGNTCVDDLGDPDHLPDPIPSNLDWDTTGIHHVDGEKDATAYKKGDAENTDQSGWHTGGSSEGKDDITDAWSYTKVVSGDVWTFFGIQRVSDNGTTTYDVELNHNANSPGEQNPSRTPSSGTPLAGGDLLLQFSVTGNGPLTFDKAFQWTTEADFYSDDCFEAGTTGFGWCPLNTVTPPAFESDHSADGLFAEGAVNLSALANANGHICTGSFGWMNIRTVASESVNAALQDYVLPFPTNIDSTCGSLKIEKRDETGVLVGGATFTISDDPRPGHSGPVTVKDGAGMATAEPGTTAIADPDGTADGDITFAQADPGSYTVTEVSPPSSDFMIDNPLGSDPNPQSTSGGHPAVFHFVDHHIWQPLTISKDASGTFGAVYHWTINKLISPTGAADTWVDGTSFGEPLVKNVQAGDDTHLHYKLVVTEDGVDTSNYVVTGTIHVGNDNPLTYPNDGAVSATIGESLSPCTIEGHEAPWTTSVPSGGADYAYTCNLGDSPPADGLKNTASVVWDRSDYPQTTDDLGAPGNFPAVEFETEDPIPFSEKAPVNKTVTITDPTGDLAADWTLTYGVGGPSHESGVYKFDPTPKAGTCTDVITNTATVVGDDGETPATDGAGKDAVDSENGKVCVEDNLSASVSVQEGLTRTYNWDIHKSTSTPPPATITVTNGQATAHYLVTVDALPYDDSDWAMTGKVHITNPNDFTDEQVSSLDIAYEGGGSCAPDADSLPLPDIAKGGSADVDFTCTFDPLDPPPALDGDVTATVKWDADAKQVDADPATVTAGLWVVTPVHEYVKVFDDHAVPGDQDPLFEGNQLRWQDVADAEGSAVDVEYDHTFSGSILPAAGSCKDVTNTAWLTVAPPPEVLLSRALAAPENALASDDATVRVCTPAVIVSPPTPPEVSPPAALPNTGGPDAWLLAAGVVLLLGGGSLVVGDRRRRRRS
jgi:LPXTG-motif cell wall-anchored protein